MPGPYRYFEFYSDTEFAALVAASKSWMLTGRITSTGGSQKTAGLDVMDFETVMKAITLEQRIRGGVQRPQKVVQIIRPCDGGNSPFPNGVPDF